MSEETKEDKIEQETPSVDENTDEKQETEAVQEENKNEQTEEKPNKIHMKNYCYRITLPSDISIYTIY